MNWSRSWSKVCDSDRIVRSPSRSASGPWCWVGRSVMFLFDCWLAGWPLISNPWCGSSGSADVAFRTPLAPYEKSKFLGSGGSMVARLKLKGIDGRAPPGVEPAA
ncbi:hypothetical protein YC2023_071975 [Brassica napus]